MPVASGAPDLLIIAFDAARQVGVADIADIRLVDPHAEGDCRDDDQAGLLQEFVLIGVTDMTVHAGMIRERPKAVGIQGLGQLFNAFARCRVDDAALPLAGSYERF